MRAGAKPVRYVSLVREVRLQNVVGVGFDAMKKSSSVESNRSATVGTSPAQWLGENIPSSMEVIGAQTLNFRPKFKFLQLNYSGDPVSVGGCAR